MMADTQKDFCAKQKPDKNLIRDARKALNRINELKLQIKECDSEIIEGDMRAAHWRGVYKDEKRMRTEMLSAFVGELHRRGKIDAVPDEIVCKAVGSYLPTIADENLVATFMSYQLGAMKRVRLSWEKEQLRS